MFPKQHSIILKKFALVTKPFRKQLNGVGRAEHREPLELIPPMTEDWQLDFLALCFWGSADG